MSARTCAGRRKLAPPLRQPAQACATPAPPNLSWWRKFCVPAPFLRHFRAAQIGGAVVGKACTIYVYRNIFWFGSYHKKLFNLLELYFPHIFNTSLPRKPDSEPRFIGLWSQDSENNKGSISVVDQLPISAAHYRSLFTIADAIFPLASQESRPLQSRHKNYFYGHGFM